MQAYIASCHELLVACIICYLSWQDLDEYKYTLPIYQRFRDERFCRFGERSNDEI